MPAFLPLILASQLVLVADRVPQFDVGPSCRASAQASDTIDPNGESCIRDEQSARVQLTQQWKNFTPAQHEQCVRLSTLGGSPSYVELLTCLEMAKQAAEIPDDSPVTDGRLVR